MDIDLDGLPRASRAAAQNFQKGYRLAVDHQRQTSLFRHADGRTLEAGYRSACRAIEDLQGHYRDRFIIKQPGDGPSPEETMTTTPLEKTVIRLQAGQELTAGELATLAGIPVRSLSQLFRRATSRQTGAGRLYTADERLVKTFDDSFGVTIHLTGADLGSAQDAAAPAPDESISDESISTDAAAGATGPAGAVKMPEAIGDPIQMRLPTGAPEEAPRLPVDENGRASAVCQTAEEQPAEAAAEPAASTPLISLGMTLEILLARAEALSELLAERLFTGDVPLCDIYLAQLVHEDLTRAMSAIRPPVID